MATSGSFNTTSSNGRYLTFNWSLQSQSVSGNYSVISWQLVGAGSSGYVICGNFKVNILGNQEFYSSTRINVYVGTVVASGTKTIYHDSAGNKSFDAYAEAGIYYTAVNCSGSGSWALPNIPRSATITGAPNFNDTDNPTITFDNPGGFALDAKIEINGNVNFLTRTNIPNTGSYQWVFTTAERNSILAQTPNSNTLTVRFTIATKKDGVNQDTFSYLDRTMTVTNANPVINGTFAVKDTNSSTIAMMSGTTNYIIQGYSVPQVYGSSATGQKSATISKYEVTSENGVLYSSTTPAINIGVLNNSGSQTLILKVTDSRGNTSTQNVAVTVTPYTKLTMTAPTFTRANDVDQATTMAISGTYDKVLISSTQYNTLGTLQYRYKKTTDATFGSYTTITPTLGGTGTAGTFSFNAGIGNFDPDTAFNFEIVVSDEINSITVTGVLPTGTPLMSVRQWGIGIGKVPINTMAKGSVDVKGDVYEGGARLGDKYIPILTTNVTDLNAIWKSGFYDIYAGSNNPSGGNWVWVIETAHSSASGTYMFGGQIGIEITNGGRAWFRSRQADGTGTWQQLVSTTPRFTWSGTAPYQGSVTVTHNLGYYPIVILSGTTGNVNPCFNHSNVNSIIITNWVASGGNDWVGTARFY
jgi:hypothetical protein